MSEAPERIYARSDEMEGWSRVGHWNVEFGWDDDDVEYVRYDVEKSLKTKLENAMKALAFYANRENWDDCRFVDEGVDEGGVHVVHFDQSTVTKDCGNIARTTLAELKGEKDD